MLKRLTFLSALIVASNALTGCEKDGSEDKLVRRTQTQKESSRTASEANGQKPTKAQKDGDRQAGDTPSASTGSANESAKKGLLDLNAWDTQAPEEFTALLETTKGKIFIDVERHLSPKGVDRFYNMIQAGYFENIAFFRSVKNFVVQFGMHGSPKVNEVWAGARFHDEEPKRSNARGTITFAKLTRPNSRSNQFFINLVDNARLDRLGFAPFGTVRKKSLRVVDEITTEYGEMPNQSLIAKKGNEYLKHSFPNLDYIKSATVLEAQ